MAKSFTNELKIINISPSASAKGLREKLNHAAALRGMKVTPLVSSIYNYAVKHQELFADPLAVAGAKGGEHIGAKVGEDVASDLQKWAQRTTRSRGFLCCYILEKVFESDLLPQIPNTAEE